MKLRLSFFYLSLLLSFCHASESFSQIKEKPPIVTKIIDVDLNGDKRNEYLIFCCYKLFNSYSYSRFVLEINKDMIVQPGDNLDGNFRIVDIDSNDKYTEIAIPESGPSDDYATHFFCFKDNKIISMGKLPGTYILNIDGSGIIKTRKRGEILCTWFFPAQYKLDENHCLQLVEEEIYEMYQRVTLKDTLVLQKSPDNPQIITTLYSKDKVTIIGCDNKKWCLVETGNGLKGWFAVEGRSQIAGTDKHVNEIFDGLFNAD